MTVDARIPIAEYVGNGSITVFAWDWYMIEDSSINVLVDNVNVSNWSVQGTTVVFSTAPKDGADIQIYRRTLIQMPENYVAFGRFHSEKTELSVDRAIMIAQEYAGDRGNGNAPNGIVGGANLSTIHTEFTVTVVSERGSDAILELWSPDDTEPPPPGEPDPSIIWAGPDIVAGFFSTNGPSAGIRFRMDTNNGVPGDADAYYPNFNERVYVSWLSVDPENDEYWMRVIEIGTPQPNLTVTSGGTYVSLDEPFKIRGQSTGDNGLGPNISVFTFRDTAPITRKANVRIDICKDSGGLPDGNWASRNVSLEAIYNA